MSVYVMLCAVPIKQGAMRNYIKANSCSYQQALDHFVAEIDKSVFIVRGIRVTTLKDACKLVPCSPEVVRRYCSQHCVSQQEALDYYTAQQDLGKQHQNRRYRRCVVCGRCLLITNAQAVTFKHDDDFCREHEVPEDIRKKSGDFKIGELEWLSFQTACDCAGVKSRTARRYAEDNGLQLQETIELLSGQRQEKTRTILGTECKTFQEMADVLGVDKRSFYRHKAKYGLDAAIEFYLKTRIFSVVTIEGKPYRGDTEIAEALGIRRSSWKYWRSTFPENTPMQDIVDIRLGIKEDTRSGKVKPVDKLVTNLGASSNNVSYTKHAYTGTDGQEYYFCICTKCHRRILLPESKIPTYVHSAEDCLKYTNPI